MNIVSELTQLVLIVQALPEFPIILARVIVLKRLLQLKSLKGKTSI